MHVRRDAFEAHADDFAWCEEVIKRNSHSFYRAFSQLPERKRAGVFAVYAFCRAADDCVDKAASRAQLSALERNLERFVAGQVPDEPLWRALDVVFACFDLEERPFFDMLEGQRRDLSFRQPETMGELEDYAYYVAGSVGLMLLPLLRAEAPVNARLVDDAVDLGVAMQLTNVLRDVGEDWDAGRVYLPASLLAQVPSWPRDFAERRVSEAFADAWETVARRAEELYLPMQQGIGQLDADSRLATLASLFLYRGILDAVRAEGYRCLDRRAVVPKEQAAELVGQAASLLAQDRER